MDVSTNSILMGFWTDHMIAYQVHYRLVMKITKFCIRKKKTTAKSTKSKPIQILGFLIISLRLKCFLNAIKNRKNLESI